MLTLYHCNTSYSSQIVRLYLEACGVPWQGKHIELRKQEHISSDYVAINPNCTVPALVDDKFGLTLINSTDILLHICNHYVSAEFQVDKELLPILASFCREQEAFHIPHLRLLSYLFIYEKREVMDKSKIEGLIAAAKLHPNKASRDFLLQLTQGHVSEMEIQQAQQAVILFIEKLHHLLSINSNSPYLFASNNTRCFTIADASAIVGLFRVIKLGMLDVVTKFSNVYEYYERIKATEYFQRANLS